jgi:hypothetical protein
MTEASAATTVFGASIVSIGALLAAGLAVILAAKKASEDVLATAKKRLQEEEAVAGALNKQFLAAKALKEELAGIASKGQFDRFLGSGGDNVSFLERSQANLQQQFNANQKSVTDEITRRAAEADRMGYRGNLRSNFINEATPAGFAKTQSELQDQIKAVATKIEELKGASADAGQDFIKTVQGKQIENLKKTLDTAVKDQQKARENTKQIIEQQNKEETASIQNKFKLQEAALKLHLQNTAASQAEAIVAVAALQNKEINAQIASTKRYYDAVIANAKDATDRQQAESNKRIAIANLEAQKQIAAIERVRKLASDSSQKFSQTLDAYKLRTEASQFSRGHRESPEMRYLTEELERFKAIQNPSSSASAYGAYLEQQIKDLPQLELQRHLQGQLNAIGRQPIRNEADRQAFDRKLIELTQGLNPADLTESLRNLAADSRTREAERIEKERDDINRQLIDALNSGSVVRIVNEAPDRAQVTTRPSQAAVKQKYPAR